MRNGLVFAVHGFLGQGEDFELLKSPLQKAGLEFYAPSIFQRSQSTDGKNNFSEILLNHINRLQTKNIFVGKKIFLGYSFGSRIGLKLMQVDANLFDEWIFLSCNPGFIETDFSAREQRISSDRIWSEMISEQNWSEFVSKWNSQPVFSGSSKKNLNILDFDLDLLKRALKEESLGAQKDFRELILNNRSRIHWLVGSRDEKFSLIGQSLLSSGILKNLSILESGHRIHLDAPTELTDYILRLLN